MVCGVQRACDELGAVAIVHGDGFVGQDKLLVCASDPQGREGTGRCRNVGDWGRQDNRERE